MANLARPDPKPEPTRMADAQQVQLALLYSDRRLHKDRSRRFGRRVGPSSGHLAQELKELDAGLSRLQQELQM